METLKNAMETAFSDSETLIKACWVAAVMSHRVSYGVVALRRRLERRRSSYQGLALDQTSSSSFPNYARC